MSISQVLVPGSAVGEVLKLDQPVSFWGGIDPQTGLIVEPSHPQAGRSVRGTILIMERGRGSSSASSVLAELLRIEHGPAAIVLAEPDSILVIGSLVANRLYGKECPIVVVDDVERIVGPMSIEQGRLVFHRSS